MNRRRFTFWLGFGLFSLADKLRCYGLDELAAALMDGAAAAQSTTPLEPTSAAKLPIHWRAADNNRWQWYERETFIDGQWKLSGITTPIDKLTGLPYTGHTGYLDDEQVPADVRHQEMHPEIAAALAVIRDEHGPQPQFRARHGRPPSKWLRSLHSGELSIWLRTIDPPEAGVSGMTTWTHLTRDHSFDPARIEGLTEPEQAKLHAAAHYGY
jgi:hypothetical protein